MSLENKQQIFDHILVPRAAIPVDKPLSFELFVKVADRYIKVANQNEHLDVERLNRYLEHEKDVLYIDRAALERFMDERFGIMFEMIVSPALAIEKRFEWFTRCIELGFVDIKIVKLHPDKFMRLDMLIQAGFDFFKNRDLRKVLVRHIFKNVEHPLSRRAIFGSCLTLSLLLNQSDCTPATFRSLFIGCLFRDIAQGVHEGQDPHMFDEFTEARDMMEFHSHPVKSIEILRTFNVVDDIIQALIEQHHEQPRGNGFPRGLKRVETFQPAQFLGLADFTVTQLERYKLTHPVVSKDAFLELLKEIMPEENQKNLPILLRAVSEAFE